MSSGPFLNPGAWRGHLCGSGWRAAALVCEGAARRIRGAIVPVDGGFAATYL